MFVTLELIFNENPSLRLVDILIIIIFADREEVVCVVNRFR